jgi:AraC-like DNA-binding protein
VMAQRYLVAGRLSLTDISYQLGFAAPSAFSRWFRHRFGTSPSHWRQEAQERPPGAARPPLPRPREAQQPTPSAPASLP